MNISILPDDNYALMDLLCWLDIESFRRTPHLESVKRDGKAKDIKTKYLNKKYYFGSKSPATRKQQNEVKKWHFHSNICLGILGIFPLSPLSCLFFAMRIIFSAKLFICKKSLLHIVHH